MASMSCWSLEFVLYKIIFPDYNVHRTQLQTSQSLIGCTKVRLVDGPSINGSLKKFLFNRILILDGNFQ